MSEELRKDIKAEIAAKQKELRRLGIKRDTMQEMICHLRARISNTGKQVQEIRMQIRELEIRLVAMNLKSE